MKNHSNAAGCHPIGLSLNPFSPKSDVYIHLVQLIYTCCDRLIELFLLYWLDQSGLGQSGHCWAMFRSSNKTSVITKRVSQAVSPAVTCYSNRACTQSLPLSTGQFLFMQHLVGVDLLLVIAPLQMRLRLLLPVIPPLHLPPPIKRNQAKTIPFTNRHRGLSSRSQQPAMGSGVHSLG